MPDPIQDRPETELTDPDLREPWPEEEEELRGGKASGYFRDHPAAKWALIAAAIVAVAGAVFVWRYYSVRESTDDAQIDGHITPISARVGGTVTSVKFHDNEFVHTGDVLVTLDPSDYKVALDRAKADLADAEASAHAAQTNIPVSTVSTTNQLATAQAAETAAMREVDVANARAREAEANYTKVSKDLERMKQLITRDEISRQQYDSAVAADQAASATVDAAHAQIAAAQSHVAQAVAAVRTAQTAPEQVAIMRAHYGAATAMVEQRQAAVEQAKLNLVYTTVLAPADGIISKRSAEVGQVVQAGQPLCALVDVGDIYVTANFKENQLRNMHPGQRATIGVDAYDVVLKGHVDSIGGATGARFSLLPPENATGNYVKVVQRIPVKIVLEPGQDPNHRLRPGMSVVPTVFTGGK